MTVALADKATLASGPPLLTLGRSNGVDDTAWINAAIAANAGGVVRGRAGQTYKISAPIVPQSDTTLDFSRCRLAFANTSVHCNMLANPACNPDATAHDASCVAGSSVIVSAALAAQAAPGHKVAVVGAGAIGSNEAGGNAPQWLYGTVASVSGNNITLTGNRNGVAAQVTIASGGTAYLYKSRDKNITIIGGNWDTEDNWSDYHTRWVANFLSSTMRLRRIDGLTIKGCTLTGGDPAAGAFGFNFGIDPADCTDVLIEDIEGDWVTSIVEGAGPLSRVTVRNIRGRSQDDMVAFGTTGATDYDCEGDIDQLLIDGVQAKGSWSAVTLFGSLGPNGASRIMSGATVKNVKGFTQLYAVRVVDYTSAFQVDVTVEDVTCVPGTPNVTPFSETVGGKHPVVLLNASYAQTVTLRNISWPLYEPLPENTTGVVQVSAGVGRLVVENIDLRNIHSGGAYGILVTGSGQINSLVVDGVNQLDAAPSWMVVALGGTGPIQHLQVKNFRTNGACTLIGNLSGQKIDNTFISGGNMEGGTGYAYVGQAPASPMSAPYPCLFISNVRAQITELVYTQHPLGMWLSDISPTIAGAALVNVNGAAASPVSIVADGITPAAAGSQYTMVARDGTQVIQVQMGLSCTIVVDAALLTPVTGQTVYNINGSFAPLGWIVYDPFTTQWSPLNAPHDLGYAQITAGVTISTTLADVAGLSITFKAPASGIVMLEFFGFSYQQLTSDGGCTFYLTDDANAIKGLISCGTVLANAFSPSVVGSVKVTGLTPNTSYTFKVRAQAGAATGALYADATYPAFLRAVAA